MIGLATVYQYSWTAFPVFGAAIALSFKLKCSTHKTASRVNFIIAVLALWWCFTWMLYNFQSTIAPIPASEKTDAWLISVVVGAAILILVLSIDDEETTGD